MTADPSIDRAWLRDALLKALGKHDMTLKEAWSATNPCVFTPNFTENTLMQLQAEGRVGGYHKGGLNYWTLLVQRVVPPPPSNVTAVTLVPNVATPRELHLEDALKRIHQRVTTGSSHQMGTDIVNIVNEALHE